MVISEKGMGNDDKEINVNVRTSVNLFRGSVQYSESEMSVLVDMFKSIRARPVLQSLLAIRGRTRYFDRSDLDDFSSDCR